MNNREKKRFGVSFVAGLLALCGVALAQEPRFDYEYQPGVLPEASAPKWTLMQRAGTATLEGGKLAVHVATGSRHYYAIGVGSDGVSLGDGDAWNLSGGKMTVDFRLKVKAAPPQVEAFRVTLGDGALTWPIIFRQGTVEGKALREDVADTYRITLDSGHMVLSSQAHGMIKERRKGLSRGESVANAIYFGSFATNKEWPLHHGQDIEWELEYIRWTPVVLPPLGAN